MLALALSKRLAEFCHLCFQVKAITLNRHCCIKHCKPEELRVGASCPSLNNIAAAQEVQCILDDPAVTPSGPEMPEFWVLVAALKQFIANEGHGSLPLEVCCMLGH